MKKLLITTALLLGISLSANASEVYTDYRGQEWTLEKVRDTYMRSTGKSKTNFKWIEDTYFNTVAYPNGKCWEGHNIKYMQVSYYDNFWKKEKTLSKRFMMRDKENPTCSQESQAEYEAFERKVQSEISADMWAIKNKKNKVKELENKVAELENRIAELEN